jgi:hypothetical protein
MTRPEDEERRRREATQAARDLEFATRLTSALRESDGTGWRQVRDRLAQEGIAPTDAAVGILFRDDGDIEFGVLATMDGRAFTFDFTDLEHPPPTDFWGRRGSIGGRS